MRIYKAVFITAMGIAVIIFGVYVWCWKQPDSAKRGENLATDEAVRIVQKGIAENRIKIISSNSISVSAFDSIWNNINPEVVLVEGRLGFFLPGLMDPVKKFGIEGRARELALEKKLMLFSYRLDDDKIASSLMQKYTQEQVAFTMVLHSYYSGIKSGVNISPENAVRECINKSRCSGIDAKFRSAREIDIIWARDFGNSKDWRYAEGLTGYAGEIALEIKTLKKKHIENLVASHLAAGKRVLIVDNEGIMD